MKLDNIENNTINENAITYSYGERSKILLHLIDGSYYSQIYGVVKRTESKDGEYDYSSVSSIGMVYLYLHRKGGQRRGNTKKEYARELLQFMDYLILHNISDLRNMKRAQIEEYQQWLEQKYEKKKTQAKKVTILSSFLKWCFDEDYLIKDLSRGLSGVSIDRSQIPDREISPKSLSKSLHYFKDNPKMQGLLMLLPTTGLRLNEVITPDWKDLYWDEFRNKHYLKTTTKRGGERHVLIRPEVLALIIEYRKRLGLNFAIDPEDTTPFFPNRYGKRYTLSSLSAHVTKKLAESGLLTEKEHKTTAHFFRHYFARSAFNQGASVDKIAKTLGHKSTQTTENYLSRELRKENDVADLVTIPGFS